MFNNPLIKRYRTSLLRPRQLWVYAIIYVSIVFLIFFVNFSRSSLGYRFESYDVIFRSIFYQIVISQIIILCFWSSYNSGSVISSEILRRSYDFFKLLPLSGIQKAVGILIGVNLISYSIAVINFLLLLIMGVLGKLSILLQIYTIFFLLALTVFSNSLTLLVSINPDVKKKRSSSIGVLAILLIIGCFYPVVINATLKFGHLETTSITFYLLKIHSPFLISTVILYFALWNVLGIVRRFHYEKESLFNQKGAVIFLIGFEVIVIGLFWPYLMAGHQAALYVNWIISFIAFILTLSGTLHNLSRYFEVAKQMQSHTRSFQARFCQLFKHTNFFFGLCLIFLWAILAILLIGITGNSLALNILPLLVISSFYIFILALLELHVLYKELYGKIKLLLIFIGLLFVFLPMIIAPIMGNNTVYYHSLIGYFGSLFDDNFNKSIDIKIQFRVLIVNILLCILPLIIIYRKYHGLLTSK